MIKSRLLKFIILISFIAVIFLPGYTFFFLHPQYADLLYENAEKEALHDATHLASMLVSLGMDFQRGSIPTDFIEEVEKFKDELDLEKINVFSASGEIIYSTDQKDIGKTNSKSYFREILAKGKTYSKIVRRDSRTLDGQLVSADIAEIYIPVMDRNRFVGAFEIYDDITAQLDRLNMLITRSRYLVFTITFVLLIAVVMSALKASRTIIERDQLEQEISVRTRAEKDLQESEGKYRSLVESTGDSIYLVDKDYRYLYMNKNHAERMGFSGDEYKGRTYSEFHSPEETKWFVKNIDKVFSFGKSFQFEHKSRRDGRYFLQTLSPVRNAAGEITAVTIVSKDVNEQKLMEARLHALSITDDLTGLFNRRGFFHLAEQQLKLANRHKMGIFMLYADLDGLKTINDTFGHREGDRALIEMAKLLKRNYRDSDIIARIGGDEFVVIPVGTTGDNVEIINARFHTVLGHHNETMNRGYTLSVSIGIAYYDPEDPCTLDEFLLQADRLMYEQKRLRLKS